jgi:glycerate dehydrogenase
MTAMHDIVFLDRDSLHATVRPPAFAHRWRDYPATGADQVVERLQGASIAITNKVPIRLDAIARLPALKMIAVAATGTDNVDLAACRARGIAVANIRDYSVVAVPEHTFALMLAVRRSLCAYAADVDAGLWQRSTRFCLLDHPIGDLAGSRLGIVGYGALGRRVAQIARAFGMEVVVHSRSRIDNADDPQVTQVPLD